MPIKGKIYLAGIYSVAVAILAMAPWEELYVLSRSDSIGVIVLVLLGVTSERLAVTFVVGDRPANSSIGFIPMFAAIVLFPIASAIAAAGIIVGTSEFLLRKRKAWMAGFNVAQTIITVGLSATVYSIFGGTSYILLRGQLADSFTINLGAFVGLAGTFFITNQLIVAAGFATVQKRDFKEIFSKLIGSAGGNVLYDLLVSPIALITAILYAEFGVPGILLVILPLLLIRYSYSAKIQLQQANEDLLKVLIKAIETRDPYTSGHSIRVSQLARTIALEMGISGRRLYAIETAALLHDIGKINAVYSGIIAKPSDLSPDERAMIQRHATEGAELLKNLTSFPDEIIQGVRHHHERFDGGGYPGKVIGTDIPLISRVIMICDSVDAMLSDRPYRRALSVADVRAELVRCAGTQFDPQIVRVVLESTAVGKKMASLRKSSRPRAVAI